MLRSMVAVGKANTQILNVHRLALVLLVWLLVLDGVYVVLRL